MSKVPLSFLFEIARDAGYPQHKSALQVRLEKEGAVAIKGPSRTSPVLFELHTLPLPLRRAWERHTGADGARAGAHDDAAWTVFLGRSPAVQLRARVRAEMARIVCAQVRAGVPLERIAKTLPGMRCEALAGAPFGKLGTSPCNLKAILARVEGVDPINWEPALAQERRGNHPPSEIPELAMAWFRRDYRDSGDEKCKSVSWRRLQEQAEQQGWALPAKSTFMKYYNKLPRADRVFDKEGAEAMDNTLRQRNRREQPKHVLDWVCLDGSVLSVKTTFDGVAKQPTVIGLTDIHSGFMFDVQVCASEDAENTLITIARACKFGKPGNIYTDNGSGFGSLRIAGDDRNAPRGRKPANPGRPVPGVLQQIGVRLHFARPYNPQAKPIEPAWGRLKRELHTHPDLKGARVSKYGQSKAGPAPRVVEFEWLTKLVQKMVDRINDFPNAGVEGYPKNYSRRQAFEAGLARAKEQGKVHELNAMERRLMSRDVKFRTVLDNGDIKIGRNLYGNAETQTVMLEHVGKRVVVQFDPLDPDAPVNIWNEDQTQLIVGGLASDRLSTWDGDASPRKAGAETKRVKERTQELIDRANALHSELKVVTGGAAPTTAPRALETLAKGRESAGPVQGISAETHAKYRAIEFEKSAQERAVKPKMVG